MKIGRTKVRRFVFLLVACSLLFVKQMSPAWFVAGAILILLGQVIQLSSYSVLVKNAELTTTGPYRFVRNPFYVGTILKDFGVCTISGNWVIMLAYVVIFLPILYRRVLKEEKSLHEKFGKQYEEFMRLVPRFLPRVSSWPKMLGWHNNIEPLLILKNRIFPRILNLWVFVIAIVEVSEVRWKGDVIRSVDHLTILTLCVAILYVSIVLNLAGKRLKRAESL
jgi:protein-S-isoprenylcysteine O-methyltransferase Ste14